MKRKQVALLGILLVFLGIVFALLQYDGYVKARFQVTDYQWNLTPDQPAVLSETLAIEGTHVALRANGYDPANWQVIPPWSDWPLLRLNPLNSNVGALTLTHRNSGAKYGAYFELDLTNHALIIAISRAK